MDGTKVGWSGRYPNPSLWKNTDAFPISKRKLPTPCTSIWWTVCRGDGFHGTKQLHSRAGQTKAAFSGARDVHGLDGANQLPTATSEAIKVTLVETLHLPALSEMEAMASTSHIAEAGAWMVEETGSKGNSVLVARAVVEPKRGQLPARLLNPTRSPVTLHRGTQIATLERVETPITAEVAEVQALVQDRALPKAETLEKMSEILTKTMTDKSCLGYYCNTQQAKRMLGAQAR